MDFIQLAFEALKERKLRASLTIFMVIIGSALLVAVNGISNGTKHYIAEEFSKFGTNLIVVTKKGTSDFKIKDWIIGEIKQLDGVLDVAPFIEQTALIYSRGRSRSVIIEGIDQSKLKYILPNIEIDEGSFVSEYDSVGILLGHQIAYTGSNEIFAWVGQTVQLMYTKYTETGERETIKKSFIVRGVLKYYGSFYVPVDQVAWISLKAADNLFKKNGEYDGLYIITEDPSYNDRIMDYIRENYDVDVLSPQSIKRVVDNIMNTITFFISSISAVSLLVASIGIITTLYTSMLERIREIGVLKAIGYKNYHILKLFLYEATIIGIVGGTLGLATGIILAYVLKTLFFVRVPFIQPIFDIQTLISTWILAAGLSLISGIYPAWRASRLDPVVALKFE